MELLPRGLEPFAGGLQSRELMGATGWPQPVSLTGGKGSDILAGRLR